ncbi:MAG: helix-turn-helix transcriptional regulator [Ruminococcaceae bacterium]|mgnify:CR=1 FL=1|nr:helix-turn-helix transcriptional regulator [Oscillospiraceae bacterium]
MRNYLKRLREEKKLSQQGAAELLGMTRQYYNLIENGERQKKMDIPLALKLAEIFDVSVEYILEQEGKVS